VAGKDHVGNPWKSIVCMYNITCIWNLVPVYSGQTFCNENVQGQGAPRQKFNENRIPYLEDDEVQAISESEKGACHS
jgi:hypothetical protein